MAVTRADDALSDGAAESEGIAHCEHDLAYADIIGVGKA